MADRRRFQEVVLVHLDAAYNLARWLSRNDHDADDIVQDACLRAFRSFAGFRGESGRPWLLAIVRNACYDFLQRNRGAPLEETYDEDIHGAESASPFPLVPFADPEARLLQAEGRRRVDDALDRLPTKFREVVVLRDIEDLSYREIAEIVSVPIGTVMSRLARGRKLMLAHLSQITQVDGNGM
jgi:RNA polymerase sigma factor (sigma-70 family)